MKHRRCHYCRRWFRPDPRNPNQQVCQRRACRRKRKADAQARWRSKNPEYFQGTEHYTRTKSWLARHPGYLRSYRAQHPAYVAADNRGRRGRKLREKQRRADMKDAMLRREIGRIRGLHGADMQDTTRIRLDGLLHILARPPRADIQDAMARAGPPRVPSLP